MKKCVLFGFAAAMTLVSCTQSEVLETAIESPMEFGAFVNKTTKAPVDNLNTAGSTFGVWGYKYKSTITTPTALDFVTVFNDFTVTYDATATPNPVWTYVDETKNQTLRYWDKTCTYDFYAYAPKDVITATSVKTDATTVLTVSNFVVSNTASAVTKTNTDPTKYLEHTDLLIADALENKDNYASIQQFTFRHVLTNVSINVNKKSGFAGEVKLTRAVLKGVTNKATSYAHTFAKAQGEIKASVSSIWTIPTSGHTADFTSAQASTTEITEAGIPLFTEMLMIPQKIDTNTFDIEYTINGETFTKTLNFAGAWTANQKIAYNIEISATAIDFGVTQMPDWTTNNQPSLPTIE